MITRVSFISLQDFLHFSLDLKYLVVPHTMISTENTGSQPVYKVFFPVMGEYQLFSLKKKTAGVITKRKCLRTRRKLKWKKRGSERKKGRVQVALIQLAHRSQLRMIAVSGLHCGT